MIDQEAIRKRHEAVERQRDADSVADELAHAHLPIEDFDALLCAVRDGAELDKVFIQRTFVALPGSKGGLGEMRPYYEVGSFPQQPTASGPGSRVMTLAELVRRARERREVLAEYGDAAPQASPPLRDPII
jgi:hypothetical protein